MHTVTKLGYVLVCTCGWRYEAITHREARRMRQHHYDGTQPSDRCVKCGGPDGFHDPACVIHPMDHQPSEPDHTNG
jgi:hypothetical protein